VSDPPQGQVIAEALTAILRVTQDLVQFVMNDEDFATLKLHVGDGLEPVRPLEDNIQEGFFLKVPIRAGAKIKQGEVMLIKRDGVTKAEYRIVWEMLYGIPPTRFDRINFEP